MKWLRPDYQKPRFGAKVGAGEQVEADLVIAEKETKPAFPLLPAARTAAIMAAFLAIEGAQTPADIARRFKQGLKVESAVRSTMRALARMGFLETERGETFSARRFAAERGASAP